LDELLMYLKPAIILSAGTASGCGKTATAEAIIRLLGAKGRVGACKITVDHGDKRKPREGKSFGIFNGLETEFQIATQKSIITQPDTDTQRFCDSGANPVVWITTRPEHLAASWDAALPLFSGCTAVVVESNSLARIEPHAFKLLTLDPTVPRRHWKESAADLIGSVDLLIFNKRGTKSQLEALRDTVRELRVEGLPSVEVRHPSELIELSGLEKLLELFENQKG
jgi:molybdopterin-guanine dinucleotide biosynthesis protein